MVQKQQGSQEQPQEASLQKQLGSANYEERMTWRMRWFLVIVITTGYITALISGIVGYWITKDPRYLLFLSPSALMPVVVYLGPMDKRRYELKMAKIDANKCPRSLKQEYRSSKRKSK